MRERTRCADHGCTRTVGVRAHWLCRTHRRERGRAFLAHIGSVGAIGAIGTGPVGASGRAVTETTVLGGLVFVFPARCATVDEFLGRFYAVARCWETTVPVVSVLRQHALLGKVRVVGSMSRTDVTEFVSRFAAFTVSHARARTGGRGSCRRAPTASRTGTLRSLRPVRYPRSSTPSGWSSAYRLRPARASCSPTSCALYTPSSRATRSSASSCGTSGSSGDTSSTHSPEGSGSPPATKFFFLFIFLFYFFLFFLFFIFFYLVHAWPALSDRSRLERARVYNIRNKIGQRGACLSVQGIGKAIRIRDSVDRAQSDNSRRAFCFLHGPRDKVLRGCRPPAFFTTTETLSHQGRYIY